MASVTKAVALLATATLFALQVSYAAVHKVGDSAGWTTIGNIDYKIWAAPKTFQVGDIIRKLIFLCLISWHLVVGPNLSLGFTFCCFSLSGSIFFPCETFASETSLLFDVSSLYSATTFSFIYIFPPILEWIKQIRE